MTDVSDKMKKLQEGLTTKEQALELIQPFENCSEVVISGKTEVDFDPAKGGDHFVLKNQNQEYSLTEAVFAKASRLIGIPETYVRKVPKELLFPHISYWLNEGGRAMKAFTRTNGGMPSVVGFAREDSYYYPVSRVFEQMDKVNPNYSVEGLEDISWRNTTLGIVYPEFEFEIKDKAEQGDWLYGGIKIRMSLLGEFPTKISAFLMTLACLNGMVSANEVYTYNRKHGFDGQDVWMVDGLNTALGALTNEVQRVQALKDVPVDNEHVTNYINQIFDSMGVNQKSRLAVLEKVIAQQPEDLYDLMNAVTSVAHSIENRGEVYHLQSVGGYIVQHAESCDTCHRPF